MLAFEPEGSSGIVYTLLHTAKHTTVTQSGRILIITVSLVDMSRMVVTASVCLRACMKEIITYVVLVRCLF